MQQNKQDNKRTFFLPKINKVFLSRILQNLKGRSGPFCTIIFENDPLARQAENDATKQKGVYFQGSQKRKMVIKIEFTLFPRSARFVPLRSVLKNSSRS